MNNTPYTPITDHDLRLLAMKWYNSLPQLEGVHTAFAAGYRHAESLLQSEISRQEREIKRLGLELKLSEKRHESLIHRNASKANREIIADDSGAYSDRDQEIASKDLLDSDLQYRNCKAEISALETALSNINKEQTDK